MRSGSSSWPGVVGSVSVLTFALGFSYMVGVCGVVVRVFGVPSRSLLGRSVLGARLIWAVVALRCAGAAAAAAPVAMLATGVAVPAEAELPAGAAMGLGSHGECTVGSPSSASAFFFDVFALLGFCARLPGSESVSSRVFPLSSFFLSAVENSVRLGSQKRREDTTGDDPRLLRR